MNSRPLNGSGLSGRGISEHAGVVTRPAGPWAPSVHHLLSWLRSTGYDFAPQPVALTDTEDQLTFLPGRDQGWPFLDDIQSVAGAFECGRFARTLTDTLARYPCPPDARWQDATGAPSSGCQLQHGDLGPWNLLWSPSGPQICGVIDWDQVEPGSPTYDLGFLAWFIVPAMDDTKAQARGFSATPDRLSRLNAFASGAHCTPTDLVSWIESAQLEFIHRVLTRRGQDSIWTRLYADAYHDSAAADRDYLRRHF